MDADEIQAETRIAQAEREYQAALTEYTEKLKARTAAWDAYQKAQSALNRSTEVHKGATTAFEQAQRRLHSAAEAVGRAVIEK